MSGPNLQPWQKYDVPTYSIETLVDGMIKLLGRNLVSATPLIADAHAGDTVIYVEDNFLFEKFQGIVLMDNNASYDSNTNQYVGIEFHEIFSEKDSDANKLVLKTPLEKDFLVSDNGRIQKAIKNSLLYDKDILYGDRAVIAFDHIAICVEPESMSNDWLAINGLLSNDYRLSIIVYVKTGGLGEEEEYALRICNTFADEIRRLLMSNIHLDLSVDKVSLARDACAGSNRIIIPKHEADKWPVDTCPAYVVQDNLWAQEVSIVPKDWPVSSSSSDSTCISCELSSSSSSSLSVSLSVSSESSASTFSSSSMTSASSSSSESSLSLSDLSTSSSISSVEGTMTSSTSSSSLDGSLYELYVEPTLKRSFRVSEKAVLKRIKRYMYDSRVDGVEYGTVQKGSVFLKAARLSWFGKETQIYTTPQLGRG